MFPATRRLLPYFVALLLMAVTAVAASAGFAQDRSHAERNRDEAAGQAARAVTAIVGGLEYRVASLRGLFAASSDVRPVEFDRFARPLLRHGAAFALGWARVVPATERPAFERAHGPIRAVKGLRLVPAPPAPSYAVLTLGVPEAIGVKGRNVNIASYAQQGAVLRRAARAGRAQASGPVGVTGVVTGGFVIYAPAYRGGGVPASVSDRERRTVGFGFGLFRFGDLRAALQRAVPAGTAIRVIADGTPVVTIGAPGAGAERRAVAVAGRTWHLDVQPTGAGGIGLGWVALIVGGLLTALVTLLTLQSVRAEGAARRLATVRQRERDALDAVNRAVLNHLEELLVIHLDRDLRIVRAAGALLATYGYGADAVTGHHVEEFVPVEDRDTLVDALERALAGEQVSFDREDRATGLMLWIQVMPMREDHGGGVLLVALDVTARAAAERARRSAEERFRRSFEDAPIGMALLDADGRYVEVNQALCEILGYPADALVGRALIDATHPDDTSGEADRIAELLDGRTSRCSFEKRAVHATGRSVWVAVHATELGPGDGEASQHLYLAQILDVTDQRRFEAQLQHMADHDPLTGVENRRAFERAIDAHLAHVRRYGAGGALLVLDLDHFKAVNDTLGHHAGDELIMAVADELRGSVRESDRVGRLGGDEFAILLPKADEPQARAVAAKLVTRIRDDRRMLGGREWRTTVSVGVALFDASQGSAEQVLVDADLAMYDAKEAGRDGFSVYLPGANDASRTHAPLAWMDRIRGALDEDRFALLAQPIIDLQSRRIVHHELLLRMIDDHGADLLPPGSFLAIAERYGLVAEIDTWVCRAAIATLAAHPGRSLTLEVNLSGASLGSPELLETIESELAATGVDPRALIFEVTETAAVSNIPRARAFAERLNALGCRFALDDFGAGFGSFSYLKHLPFDFLKIDGEFVRHCATSSVDRVIISSLVRVATGLGKRTIAEYVDDQATIDLLHGLGVDLAQGYAIGKPAPLESWLTGSRGSSATATGSCPRPATAPPAPRR